MRDLPQLALPKNTSEQIKHLREPGRSFQIPVRGRHSAQLASKADAIIEAHLTQRANFSPTAEYKVRAKKKQSHPLVSPPDLASKTQFEGGIRKVRHRLSGVTDTIYKLACSAWESGGRDIYHFLPGRLIQAHKFGQFPRASSSLQQISQPRSAGEAGGNIM